MARKKLEEMLKTPSARGRFLGTHQAAHMLGLSPTTVKLMVENGELPAWKTAGGHRRIPAEALEALARRHESVRGTALRQVAAAAGPTRVLIAEDDLALQRLYQSKLSTWKLGLQVAVVDNGMDALVAIGKLPPDVLLADLAMPRIDGFQMIRTLRMNRDLNGMDIIAITGLDDAEIGRRGGMPPGVLLLRKPVPFDQILGLLQGRELRRQMAGAAPEPGSAAP
jgi:excisionase family DNA binding protein